MPTEESAATEEVAKLLAARSTEEFLVGIKPHLRRLVLAVDEDLVAVFDSSFGSEATALVEKLGSRHSDGHTPMEESFQGAGWREFAVLNIVAFTVNLAASIAFDIGKSALADPPPISIVGLTKEQQDKVLECFRNDPVLRQLPVKTQINPTR